MFRHIVFIKLKDGRADTADLVRDLVTKIAALESVHSVDAGVDLFEPLKEGQVRYDMAMQVTFESREALESYIVDPRHFEAAAELIERGTSFASVDYEFNS